MQVSLYLELTLHKRIGGACTLISEVKGPLVENGCTLMFVNS